MPEYLLTLAVTAILGWGGFTWKKAENAAAESIKTNDRVDKLELKVAETYLTKQEFQTYMDRLLDSLSEMKSDIHYLTDRLDYHIAQQNELQIISRLEESRDDS